MNFLKRLFGKTKRTDDGIVPDGIPVRVDGSSQDYKLQNHMTAQKMTHDGTVEANISNVRVHMEYGVPKMYFCGMRGIDVLKKISKGDGGPIPQGLVLEKLNFPFDAKQGYYDLKNVKLHSNGTMQIIATAATQWDLIQAD